LDTTREMPCSAANSRGLKPEVQHAAEGDVEEVSGAAGGVEDADGRQFLNPLAEQPFRGKIDAEASLFPVACGLFSLFERKGLENALLCGLPALLEGADEHRLDEQKDVFFAGVMRADEGAAGWGEGSLEEGAKDGRGDVGPVVVFGDFVKDAEVAFVELNYGRVVEQSAVEVPDACGAKNSVLLTHGFKEELELAEELAGAKAVVALDHVAEDAVGEQADGVREEAEEQAHEEVGDFFAGCAEVAVFEFEAFGEAAEEFGCFLGDQGVGVFGAEYVVIAKERAEDLERGSGQVAVTWLRLRSSRVKA
jgi:hypothetical protein